MSERLTDEELTAIKARADEARFSAHARTDVPRLLAEIRHLRSSHAMQGVTIDCLQDAADALRERSRFVIHPHDGEASFTLGCWCGRGIELDTHGLRVGREMGKFWAEHRCCGYREYRECEGDG